MTTFAELGVPHSPFAAPTPIQIAAIPPVLEGRDVLGLAQTGSGKTAAYGLPLLARLPSDTGTVLLVVTPTRELAHQIGERLAAFGPHGIRVVTGGAEVGPQIRALSERPPVVVGTPGRLLDLVRREALDLSGIRSWVLDEADQLLDRGFRDDLLTLADHLPARQSLLFSATLSDGVQSLVRELLSDPVRIEADAAPPGELVEQVYYVNGNDLVALLKHLVDDPQVARGLIFSRTKKQVDRLAAALPDARPLHGDLSQSVRSATLDALRKGEVRLLVCTDVAARGLDLPALSHVINVGMPFEPETYIHRVGRTARAGRDGTAWSLCTAEDGGRLRDVERLTGKPLEPVLHHPWTDFSAIPDPRATAKKPTGKRRGRRKRR